jgi:hypothetical protein
MRRSLPPHQLTSNPNPSQVDCPELNTPMLAPGDQFTATVANQNEACGFDDSLNPPIPTSRAPSA